MIIQQGQLGASKAGLSSTSCHAKSGVKGRDYDIIEIIIIEHLTFFRREFEALSGCPEIPKNADSFFRSGENFFV